MRPHPTRSRSRRATHGRAALVVTLCTAVALLAGCGSSGHHGSPTTDTGASSGGRPAYCTQLDALKTSLHDLTKINVLKEGTNAVKSGVDKVKANATALATGLKGQFSSQTAALKNSLHSLANTVGELGQSPSAATVSKLGVQISAVSTAAGNLVSSASPKCS